MVVMGDLGALLHVLPGRGILELRLSLMMMTLLQLAVIIWVPPVSVLSLVGKLSISVVRLQTSLMITCGVPAIALRRHIVSKAGQGPVALKASIRLLPLSCRLQLGL